jgi:hypothetical protein
MNSINRLRESRRKDREKASKFPLKYIPVPKPRHREKTVSDNAVFRNGPEGRVGSLLLRDDH